MHIHRHGDGHSDIGDEIASELSEIRLLRALLKSGLRGPENRQAEIHRVLALDAREWLLRQALDRVEGGEGPLSEAIAMILVRVARDLGELERTAILTWFRCCVRGVPVTPGTWYDLLLPPDRRSTGEVRSVRDALDATLDPGRVRAVIETFLRDASGGV